MKNWMCILLTLSVGLFAFGCAQTRHVMILPDDADHYDLKAGDGDESILEGKWLLDTTGEVWEFEYDKSGFINLNINEEWDMDVSLLDYGYYEVLFTYSAADDFGGLTGLFQVRKEEGGLTLLEIDPGWMERLSRENPEERWSRSAGDNLVVMTSDESVDRLLKEHGQDPGAFRLYGVLRPLKESPQ
jgi:hypothetical protein